MPINMLQFAEHHTKTNLAIKPLLAVLYAHSQSLRPQDTSSHCQQHLPTTSSSMINEQLTVLPDGKPPWPVMGI